MDKKYGDLLPLEEMKEIPFPIRRVYCIYDVPSSMRRGYHSHIDLEQVLVCIQGQVTIMVKTPFEEENVVLGSRYTGLYVGPMVWREMYDFSKDSVLLVLASKPYDVDDYIRDYNAYKRLAYDYFSDYAK